MTTASLTALRRAAPFIASAMVAAIGLALAPAQAAPRSDSTTVRATQDTGHALVQLQGEPLTTSAKTRPAKGKKVDFNNSATKAYRAQLSALRNDYKAWLRANVPAASISGEFDVSLNAVAVKLNGATLGQVAAASMVRSAQYQGLYYPNATDPDLAIIQATDAWAQAGGAANAGAGVKVAIVDSGIDNGHPCFSGAGYEAQSQLGDPKFTNNKVIAAKVFNNKTPSQRHTPQAVDSHGTHVAGTVGCNFETPTSVDGVELPYRMSGVAPRALLGNYNVFPGTVANARSEDILNALEAAYADGFDIANISLGGGSHGIQDLLSMAVDNMDRANMVVAVSAGNDGPNGFTVGSPGIAPRALTAGASSVGHRVIYFTQVDGASYLSFPGEFGRVPAGGLTRPLAVVADPASAEAGLSLACTPLQPGSLSDRIALLSRGTCDFATKILNAQNAGAAGVIVVNREAGEPIVMGGNDAPVQPTIPAFMVGLDARATLLTKNGAPARLPDTSVYEYDPARANILADFSSHGPTDVDFRVKPDVVAPGDSVLSSFPAHACAAPPCFAFLSGTSMASPHLAGSAAIVKQQRPALSAAEIRSAIVNTAVRGTLKDTDGSTLTRVSKMGAGLEDLVNATGARLALDPVSVSFGALPAGSGQTRTLQVTVSNTTNAPLTVNVAASGGGNGIAFSVDGSSLTLAAGASGVLRVSVVAAKGAKLGEAQGWLTLSSSAYGELAHAALYTLVK
jgi:subtilisin family serine protease